MKQLRILILALVATYAVAQPESKVNRKAEEDKAFVVRQLQVSTPVYQTIAKDIWDFAELGYLETKSSALLQQTLTQAGFKVETGVAEIPTAFVATYGSGKPVIGILAEFDALPGLSQDTVPFKKPLVEGSTGHGCGHNLFGTASSAAAISIKQWLEKNKRSGTVRLYGTPAEEGGGGKTFMVRAGLFEDVDAVLHWHPSDHNSADAQSCLAVIGANFRFYGTSSHAAGSPHVGRSALDGVESMNYMVNLLREHMPQEARIHYVITKGGLAANVVPDYAEVEYMVRHPNVTGVLELWDRVIKAAEGAATGTGTRMDYEIVSGLYNLMPNETLGKLMHANLTKVGGVNYSGYELDFAKKIQSTFSYVAPPLARAQSVEPFKISSFPASTDVGDISWLVPTTGLGTATWVPGTAAHTWQAVAVDGMGIGMKGMMNAAKVMAMTGIDLFTSPMLIDQAKEELKKRRGVDFKYKSLVGDRKPPLDYRVGMR
jgi:aminobenzoyl-glutamate utilization protein B